MNNIPFDSHRLVHFHSYEMEFIPILFTTIWIAFDEILSVLHQNQLECTQHMHLVTTSKSNQLIELSELIGSFTIQTQIIISQFIQLSLCWCSAAHKIAHLRYVNGNDNANSKMIGI